MHKELTVGVLITIFSGIVSIIILWIVSRIHKVKRLTLLFTIVLLLNIIWFSALIFYYFRPFLPCPAYPDKIYWFEFLALWFIYLIRFGFLLSLLSLIQNILGQAISRKGFSVVRTSLIVLSVIWFVGWVEIPFLGSRHMVDQLMFLTDFLLFAMVVAATVYMHYRTAFLPVKEYRRAIQRLAVVIIFPMSFGLTKLVIGPSLGEISYVFERLMIYLPLVLFNVLAAWWGTRYGSILPKYNSLVSGPKSLHIDALAEKYKITKREMEVIELIRQGKTNREISGQLFISVETVKDHNYNIFQKTGVKNRIQLVNVVNRFQGE